MPYGKTVYARDIQWSDPLVAVFIVVPRFVVSLVSSLSGVLGREVKFLSPLRLWLPRWSLIPSQVLTRALGSVRNSEGFYFAYHQRWMVFKGFRRTSLTNLRI